MNTDAILAASFISRAGWGNSRSGMHRWPDPVAAALERGELEILRWRTLFNSDAPRFGRMDHMSRLGLMAVELLEGGFAAMEPHQRDSIGVCVETRSGCTETDRRFLEMPLASTFAYTLPSTVLGEICIHYRLRGPVMCLLPLPGQPDSLDVGEGWLDRGEATASLCVACDIPDNRIAMPAPQTHDACDSGWTACALLMARDTAAMSERLPRHVSLTHLAQSLCAPKKNAPHSGA